MSKMLYAPKAIITGHVNADLDAIASMVAVQKLYPEAAIVAPPFLARDNNHPFYLGLQKNFHMLLPKECDLSHVSLLILVDTRVPERVKHIAEVLGNPHLSIHIYDHHPGREKDLTGEIVIIEKIGSTTAMLVHLLKEKKIPLSPDEATLLALGIYEDTGSFKHSTTTEKDFTAAAHLLQFDPSFDIIKHFTSELTGSQVHLLDTLLDNATTHNIQGTVITITEINLEVFHEDFASVVDKFMALEGLTTVLALAVMDDRVHIIARSSNPLVDVGKLCEHFGGGGHPQAASASVRNLPLAEIRSEVLALLTATITPLSVVGLYMTSPAKTILDNQTIGAADNIMARYGLKAVPIVDAETKECVGVLEQQTASKAATLHLGTLPVTEYMQRNFHALSPDSPLPLAFSIILRERQRLIPIINNNTVAGVLTRTDIIRLLIEEPLSIPDGIPLSKKQRDRNIAKLLKEQLSKEQLELLIEIGQLADEKKLHAFLVGGCARDILLEQASSDFDIAVEGDAISFAGVVAQRLQGNIKTHEHFKTATISYRDKYGLAQHLDIATTRLEFYEHPAALPTVERSSIKMDLFRRDFSINALAIQINEHVFGDLIDPFGGQRDLKEKRISVLHSLSFVEDPTRIFRAVRFEQRFGFTIGTQTERLIKNALNLGMVEKLSRSRLFNELKHIFQEKNAPSCLRRLNLWQILPSLHPLLRITPVKDVLLDAICETIAWYTSLPRHEDFMAYKIYLLGFCGSTRYMEASSLLERLGYIDSNRKQFLNERGLITKCADAAVLLSKKDNVANSEWYALFTSVPIEGLLYILARYGEEFGLEKHISLYLTQLQYMKLQITGADLAVFGEKPGPLFGQTLRHVFTAYLDGEVQTRKEQLDMAEEFLRTFHASNE